MSKLTKAGMSKREIDNKRSDRWQIKFMRPEGSDQIMSAVSAQVVSILIPSQFYDGTKSGIINFEYEDDVLNSAVREIYDVAVSQLKFNLVVNMLNGEGEVLEAITFVDCVIYHTYHVEHLDYKTSGPVHRAAEIHFEDRTTTYWSR